jgi:Ran GTPase-activating protein (RanGAP) involved in mRNA processing and transport
VGVLICRVFAKMGSFTTIQVFQNGIREEGMLELLKSLAANKNLSVLKLNDNLIKDASTVLVDVLPSLTELTVLDISDSLLGNEHSLKIFQVLAGLKNLKEIYCNYNEIEKTSVQKTIFEICLNEMEGLQVIQLKGNEINPNLWKKFKADLKNKVEPYSDEEEMADEEDEEELAEKIEKIKLDK